MGHIYGRLDKPKFWDTINRVFKSPIFNDLNTLIVARIKSQLEYPESARDFIWTKSLFTAIDDYTLGTKRTLNSYWCETTGEIPKVSELGKFNFYISKNCVLPH